MACGYEDTYILLYRKLLYNGHFSLPHIAFKMFIYLLLKANRFPDKKWRLAIGECWVSYADIQADCAEGDGNVLSKATVAKMLGLLERGGYIQRIVREGVGMKVKVQNYSAYQLLDSSPAGTPGRREGTTGLGNEPPPKEKGTAGSAVGAGNTGAGRGEGSLTGTLGGSLAGSADEHIQECNKEDKRIKKVRVMDHYHNLFVDRFGVKPFINGGKDGALLKKVVLTYGEEKVRGLLSAFFASEDRFIKESGYSVGAFVSQVNKLVIASREVAGCGEDQRHISARGMAGEGKGCKADCLPFGVRCAGEDD
jgi:hypothetical protein